MDELEKKASLRRSINLTILSYITIQFLVFLVFSIPGGFFSEFWLGFFIASIGFHIFLFLMLRLFIDDFKKETNGEYLSKINMANRITLMRISTLPTLFYLVIAAKKYTIRYPLLILVVFIFITDFLDGYVSRKANQVTKVGRMMDSASDYCLLIVLSLVFRYYSLIPLWFLVLVLLRLGIQVIFVASLIFINRRIETRTTFLGKAGIASKIGRAHV